MIAPVFDERDIREGLSGGGGHKVMIPLLLMKARVQPLPEASA